VFKCYISSTHLGASIICLMKFNLVGMGDLDNVEAINKWKEPKNKLERNLSKLK